MTDSAKLLKNYYGKESNKIVFRHSMNLNQFLTILLMVLTFRLITFV